MKRKNLEIIVLSVGVIIIAAALYLIFIGGDNSANSEFLVNLVFATGFLTYIIYSWLSSNNSNKDIRGLNAHVKNLKEQIAELNIAKAKKEKELNLKIEELNLSENERASLKEALNQAKSEIEELKKD